MNTNTYIIVLILLFIIFMIFHIPTGIKIDKFQTQNPYECDNIKQADCQACGLHCENPPKFGQNCKYKCQFRYSDNLCNTRDKQNITNCENELLCNYDDERNIDTCEGKSVVDCNENKNCYFDSGECKVSKCYFNEDYISMDSDGILSIGFEGNTKADKLNKCNQSCEYSNRDGDQDYRKIGSNCNEKQCNANCLDIFKNISEQQQIHYKDMPTNIVTENEIDQLKTLILDNLDDPNFKSDLQNKFNLNVDDIQNKLKTLDDLVKQLIGIKSNTLELQNGISDFKSFQDKYSKRLGEILDSNSKTPNQSDIDISVLNHKLAELQRLSADLSGYDQLTEPLNKELPWRSLKSNHSNIKLNLMPVKYCVNEATDSTPCMEFTNFRNGLYLIHIENDKYLKYDENTLSKLVVSGIGSSEQELRNLLVITNWKDNQQISNPENYFFVHYIKNFYDLIQLAIDAAEEVNPLLTNVLTDLQYPFYVVESAQMPGYIIHLYKNDNNNKIYLDKITPRTRWERISFMAFTSPSMPNDNSNCI